MLTHANLDDSILLHMRRDFVTLPAEAAVGEALAAIRAQRPGDQAIYFYVVDELQHLVGVLPVRRLLTAAPDAPVERLMLRTVVTVPDTFTVLEACELFAFHRFLALPVTDRQQHLLGVVDVGLFTEEVFDMQERRQMDELFETLGFHLSRIRGASPWVSFRIRFPWLLATIASGVLCALVASRFADTLARSVLLAFFLTLVLGLGESLSVQVMTIVIHALRRDRPRLRWYLATVVGELLRTLLLGLAGAGLVAAIVLLWQRDGRAAAAIAAGILTSLFMACLLGVSVPTLLHRLRLDLKVAAGPLTLALTDVCTVLAYLTWASLLL